MVCLSTERLRLKNGMTTFPPAPNMLSPHEQFASLVPESVGLSGDAVHLGKGALLTLDSAAEVMGREESLGRTVRAYNYVRRLKREKAWAPYEDIGCVWRNINRSELSWQTVRSGRPH